MRSVSGFYEQYSGKVEVYAENDEQAVEKAFRKLKATTFSDRDRSMWKVEKVERSFN